jgi:hypothetical protein
VVKIRLLCLKMIICKQFNQSLECSILGFHLFFAWYSWGDIQVPWDPLDEDGNEEEFEDTVSLSLT